MKKPCVEINVCKRASHINISMISLLFPGILAIFYLWAKKAQTHTHHTDEHSYTVERTHTPSYIYIYLYNMFISIQKILCLCCPDYDANFPHVIIIEVDELAPLVYVHINALFEERGVNCFGSNEKTFFHRLNSLEQFEKSHQIPQLITVTYLEGKLQQGQCCLLSLMDVRTLHALFLPVFSSKKAKNRFQQKSSKKKKISDSVLTSVFVGYEQCHLCK